MGLFCGGQGDGTTHHALCTYLPVKCRVTSKRGRGHTIATGPVTPPFKFAPRTFPSCPLLPAPCTLCLAVFLQDIIDLFCFGQELGSFFGDDNDSHCECSQIVAFQGFAVVFILFKQPVVAIVIAG